uniref:Uncharacterized protein n=1 Tax=Panagrolaimus sp. ES5 TaxID=591445 RepID=A0AC34G045_9BILA
MLQTTSSALQKSKSFTINDATLTSGIVLYARIDNSGSDMVLINGYINAKNNTVYLEGDFRVAKFLRKNGLDNFNVNAKYNKMSADMYLNDEEETTIDIETGKYQMFPISSMIGVSFLGETTVSINFKTYQHHLITAWNISIDQSLSTYDEKELEIAYDFRWLLFSSLTLDGTWKSINEFKVFFRQGFAANVLSGTLHFDDSFDVDFSNGFIQYTGTSILYQSSATAGIQQMDNVFWNAIMKNGKMTFNIEKGFVNKDSTQHFNTIITLLNGAEIQLTGGTLYRNSSHGYIISNPEITSNGIDLSETGTIFYFGVL